MTGPRGGAPARLVAMALLLAVGMALLSGCGALHSGVTAEANECALALPAAVEAVGHQGRLLLIRPMDVREADRIGLLTTVSLVPTTAPKRHSYCVVVFVGPFSAGTVSGTRAGGRYAILLADPHNQQVAGTLVVDQLPRSVCVRHQSCMLR